MHNGPEEGLIRKQRHLNAFPDMNHLLKTELLAMRAQNKLTYSTLVSR